MSTADKLRAAKALIEDPARWCQGTYARDKNGRDVNDERYANKGVAWCAEGALFKVGALTGGFNTNELMYKAAQDLGFRDQVELNDHTDHPTVMKMFDRAIELASIEETPDER